MKRISLFILTFALGILKISAQNYAAVNIPHELAKNANAVIRYSLTEFIYGDMKSATEKQTLVITVLNRQGDKMSDFICYGDQFRTLKSFSGEIYDKDGKSIRKIKRSEVQESEYSNNLADDDMYYFLSPKTSYYPYTVKYEYEISWKNGIISFPSFIPVHDTDISLEEAVYRLSVPKGCEYLCKNVNTDIQPIAKTDRLFDIYEWTLNNFQAVKRENFAPAWNNVFPIIYLSPENFSYDNREGNKSDWYNLGKWYCSLLEGRDVIPASLQHEIRNMTDGLTELEKVKALYDYLGKHTRYVSIQLGIGGWQPISAADVYKNKFGDCKALSNFLKAMLKECGINAYCTIINMGHYSKNFFKDYATLSANHMILQVPLENDTMWLECTNPETPFGYTHMSIAGHDVLICKDGTFDFSSIPKNPDSLNLMVNNISVNIDHEGNAKIHANKSYQLEQYEMVTELKYMDEKEKINRLQQMFSLPIAKIQNVNISEEKSAIPVMTVDFDVEAHKYASNSGSRFFLPVNPFNHNSYSMEKERNLDLEIVRGYRDVDTIILNLPENMTVEAMPKPVSMKCTFGEFSLNIEQERGKITILQTFMLRSGNYSKEKYEEFAAFMKALENIEKSKIVLKRE